MEFIFNVRKAVAAAEYLCAKTKREADLLCLVKMLYAADRIAIIKWHRSITGDSFVSMDNGPVVSRIYNLMRYKAAGSDMDAWSTAFAPRDGNTIRMQPKAEVNTDPLSQREEEALDEAFNLIFKLRKTHPGKSFIDALHDMFPEWRDPKGSSLVIDAADFLRFYMDGSAIDQISREVESLDSARVAFE